MVIPLRRLYTNLIIVLLFLVGCSPIDGKSLKPHDNNGKKWRIAYYEGVFFDHYQGELIAVIHGLQTLGWLDEFELPKLPDDTDTAVLWSWLAVNAQSDTIEFVSDAYWSAGWDEQTRQIYRDEIIKRLNSPAEIDLIIAMGTWAGQDLANNLHHVPTLVMSTSNPVQAGIIKSGQDSGFDHVHAKYEPDRYQKQIKLAHDLLDFSKLGVIYDDTEMGRIYANLEDVKKIAEQEDFEIAGCIAQDNCINNKIARKNIEKCLGELAQQIDAFYYLSTHCGMAEEFLPELLEPLYENRIPTFAADDPYVVNKGVLMSFEITSYEPIGRFQAENIARIFNGCKPRDLEQFFKEPKGIIINKNTAQRIGYDVPPGLLKAADDIIE